MSDFEIQKLEELGFDWNPGPKTATTSTLPTATAVPNYQQHYTDSSSSIAAPIDGLLLLAKAGSVEADVDGSSNIIENENNGTVTLYGGISSTTTEAAAAGSSSNSMTGNNSAGTINLTWNDRLEELVAFKAIHGHCNVTRDYKGNKSLGTWVQTQRQRKKEEGRSYAWFSPPQCHVRGGVSEARGNWICLEFAAQ